MFATYVETLTAAVTPRYSTDQNLRSDQYVSGIHYVNGQLEFMQTSEGRLVANGGTFEYEYNITDHLGNVRVVLAANGDIVQTSDYYPFGMLWKQQPTGLTPTNHYLYNGKELQTDLGLDWMDYGARMYDGALGRWQVLDPLADKYLSYSPYHYAYNNPLLFVDPDGREIWIVGEGGDRYKYENGKVYNSDGEEYSGDDEFVKKVVSSLNNTAKNSATANEMISTLSDSEFVYNINHASNRPGENKTNGFVPDGGAEGPSSNGTGAGGNIYWDPENQISGFDENGNNRRPAKIGLIHELAHAEDAHIGTLDDGLVSSESFDIKFAEFVAVHRENQVRSELGLPLRKYYASQTASNGVSSPAGPVMQAVELHVGAPIRIFYNNYDYRKENPQFIPAHKCNLH